MSQVNTVAFQADVYDIVRQIPVGKVLSYGDVARLAGYPSHSRLVGRVLRQCADDADVPCHRVVDSCGRLSCRFLAQKGFLQSEGVAVKPNGCVDMHSFRWRVDDIAL